MIHLLVPPQNRGGVYDFARTLQAAIGSDLACLANVSEKNASDWKVGPDDTVLLQYSGYGFARRGAPIWLLRALETRRHDIKRLGIYFHELHAFGPPWRSSFWLSPLQRHIASRLAKLSDFWMTNREGSAQWLSKFSGEKPHVVLPVFSNVGESLSRPEVRFPRIVVFGSPSLRQKTYQVVGDKLYAWARQASLEVHDIGAPIVDAQLAETMSANGVIQHGLLDENEVGNLMDKAKFGLLAYPVHVIAKSGVFAAYCAHGICPILLSDSYEATDGVVAARHYLTGIPSNSVSVLEANQIGDGAWSWYQGHRVAVHAKKILRLAGLKATVSRD